MPRQLHAALEKLSDAALREALLGVSGIGEETADDILVYAFGRPSFIIDAYTRRLGARIGFSREGESYAALQRLFQAHVPREAAVYGEYHALIVEHAKVACRKVPRCGQCCLRRRCDYAGCV